MVKKKWYSRMSYFWLLTLTSVLYGLVGMSLLSASPRNDIGLPIVAAWEVGGLAFGSHSERILYYAVFPDGKVVYSQALNGVGQLYSNVLSSNALQSLTYALSTNEALKLSSSTKIMVSSPRIRFIMISIHGRQYMLAYSVTQSDWVTRSREGQALVKVWESIMEIVRDVVPVNDATALNSGFPVPLLWDNTLLGVPGQPFIAPSRGAVLPRPDN